MVGKNLEHHEPWLTGRRAGTAHPKSVQHGNTDVKLIAGRRHVFLPKHRLTAVYFSKRYFCKRQFSKRQFSKATLLQSDTSLNFEKATILQIFGELFLQKFGELSLGELSLGKSSLGQLSLAEQCLQAEHYNISAD